MVALVILAQTAFAGFNTCTSADAPSNVYLHDCDGLCTYTSTTDAITCDIDNFCSGVGGDLTIIGRYGTSLNEYSAWVTCDDVNTTVACCTYNEGAGEDVDTIYAMGTQYDDYIYFHYGPTIITEELKPTANHDLVGVMDGEAGNDHLNGSPHDQNDYTEYLHGDDGDDSIEGNEGGDKIWGGTGNDVIYGQDGPDRMIGGWGDDELYGGDGDDVLCDANGHFTSSLLVCATDDGHILDAGEGEDFIWFDKIHTNCTQTMDPSLSTASTAGAQGSETDTCGDDNDWTANAGVDWPDYCDVPTDIAPSHCDDPWPY
jgi:hypothetical protein